MYDLAMKTGRTGDRAAGLCRASASGSDRCSGTLSVRSIRKQALASGVIPQITADFWNLWWWFGQSSAALTDFTFMADKGARLFVNSPNAIEDNYEAKCDTSSALYQSEETGLVDGVGSEEEILAADSDTGDNATFK